MFKKIGIYETTRWSSGLRKSIVDEDKKGEYKPKTKEVKKRFEDIFSIFKVKDINDFENFIINLKKKANLESDFVKLKIDLSNDFDRIMRGVNLLRLRNNPINLKKSDIKTILLKK